jgi:hypothetical protein
MIHFNSDRAKQLLEQARARTNPSGTIESGRVGVQGANSGLDDIAKAIEAAVKGAARYASGFSGKDKVVAEAGWLAGYTGTESSDRAHRIYNEAYEAGRRARQSITGVEGRQPPPEGTGRVIVEDHFAVPHSGNDGGPFCRFGQVWYDYSSQQYLLGLEFVDGSRFIYPNQRFPSAQQVIASVMGYRSMSWATNPKSPYFDARFGKGNYQRV